MSTQTRAQVKSAARDLARDQVFDTAELLEMILLYLDPKDALVACRINKACQNTFNGSTLLKRQCFLEQDPSSVASKPTMSDIWCAATEDEDGDCDEDLFEGWPEGTAAGLYNPMFLRLEDYADGYQDMPFKYGTPYKRPLKQLPGIFLEYDDRDQTGRLAMMDWPHLSSAELGSLGQMYFTSHPIPKLKVEVSAKYVHTRRNRRGRNWWYDIEVTLRNPRLGQVIDVCFGLITKASLMQKRRKEHQRELMALQYHGPWELNIEDENEDMSEHCKAFARDHGLEKWAKIFDEELAGLCLDEMVVTNEKYYSFDES